MAQLHCGQRSLIRRGGLWSLSGLMMVLGSMASRAEAVDFPPCPPPAANEYLLLVRGETETERTRVQDLLPSNSTVMICSYLDDTVVRAGGFSNLENANAWAQYMTEVEGLQAFVARPATTSQVVVPTPTPETSAAPATAQPSTPTTEAATAPQPTPAVASPSQSTFTPQPLGAGYAVLVDYQNRPEVAVTIQDKIGQAVGLAIFRQRAYLLIAHSNDSQGAITTLSVLSDLGISGFIVDSRETVMLTPKVALASTP